MKKCSICEIEKEESYFCKNKSKKDGLQSSCKACRKKYWDKEYKNNKNTYLKRRKKQQEKNRERLKEYKKTLSCVSCGEKETCCLEFHHLDPSKKDFNIGMSLFHSDKKFQEEIEKCICVCANCHKKIHANIIKPDSFNRRT